MTAATALTHLRAYIRDHHKLPMPALRKHLMAATDALWSAEENSMEAAARTLIDSGCYQAALTLLEAATGQGAAE